ncbi:hypothetical protein Aperf_G00000086059 [Anoplocephala perfoliata]
MASLKLSSSNSSASQQQNQQSTHHQFQDTALGCYIIELEADTEKIYSAYMGDAPPSASLIRQPLLIERLLTEKQECYAYLYTYASVTVEEIDLSTDVAKVRNDVLEASRICEHWNVTTGSAVSLRAFRDLPTLLQCLQHPAIVFSVFRFLCFIFRDYKHYCIVVNELASLNPCLRPAILFFVSELLVSQMEGMEDLSQLEYKRMLVGLLVHLITCGYVLSAIRKMHTLFERNHVGVSIAPNFATEHSSIECAIKLDCPMFIANYFSLKLLSPVVQNPFSPRFQNEGLFAGDSQWPPALLDEEFLIWGDHFQSYAAESGLRS